MAEPARFGEKIRVRYSEVDAQAIVFNSHYLTYADVTFAEYMRHLGFTLEQQIASGLDPVLVKSDLRFRSPARLDDVVEVCPRITRLGRTSLVMDFDIYRDTPGLGSPGAGDKDLSRRPLLVTIRNLYVNVDLSTGRTAEIPPAVRAILEPEVVLAPLSLYLEIGAKDGWCMTHCPELPGVGYKAASREAAVAVAGQRLAAELEWARRAGCAPEDRTPSETRSGVDDVVAGEVVLDVPVATGDTEATFPPDLEPLDDSYLSYALGCARASRRTLLELLERMGPAGLDWRPAEGKRTIGEVVGHLADAEAFYIVRLPDPDPVRSGAELWEHYAGRDLGLGPALRLARTRELVLERLGRLSDDDRRKTVEARGETWTARKVLRRLAWHERYHTRQIENWLAP